MRTRGGDHVFRCPCYDDYTEFQKIVDMRDDGLVIYRRKTQNKDKNVITDNVNKTDDVIPCAKSEEDILILQNTKDTDMLSADIMPTFDKNKINCPRCRRTIENAQNLLKNIPKIKRNDILGICDHCRKKGNRFPCKECDEAVKEFVNGKDYSKNAKPRSKTWLSKVQHLLMDKVIREDKLYKQKRRSCPDINKLCISPKSLREPEITGLFYSKHLNTSSQSLYNKSNCSYYAHLEFPNVENRTAMIDDNFDKRYTVPTKNEHSKSYQDFSFERCDSTTFLDTLRDLRHPDTTSTLHKKPIPVLSRLIPGKYNSEESVTLLDKYQSPREEKFMPHAKRSSDKKKEKYNLPRQSSPPDERYRSILRPYRKHLPSENNAPDGFSSRGERKSEETNLISKYKSEGSIATSISGIIEDHLKQDFRYFFPHEGDKKRRILVKHISSSELIKETQDIMQARAEKERINLEEDKRRKMENQEKKKLARDGIKILREAAKKQAEEAKKLAEEAKKLAEEEKILTEQKAKTKASETAKSFEGTEKKSKEKNKLLSQKSKEKLKSNDFFKEKSKNQQSKSISNEQMSKPKSKLQPMKADLKQQLPRQESKKKLQEQPLEPQHKGKPETISKVESKKDKVSGKEDEKISGAQLPKQESKKQQKEQPLKSEPKGNSAEPSSKDESKKDKGVTKASDNFNKLVDQRAMQEEKNLNLQKLKEEEERKAREAIDKTLKENIKTTQSNTLAKRKEEEQILQKPKTDKKQNATTKDLKISQIKVRKPSIDDQIIKLVKLKQEKSQLRSENRLDVSQLLIKHASTMRRTASDAELDLESIANQRDEMKESEIIIGQEIFKYTPPILPPGVKQPDGDIIPLLFKAYHHDVNVELNSEVVPIDNTANITTFSSGPQLYTKDKQEVETDISKGVVRYTLSDRSFIDKGWTMLPTEKVVRKMNIYRMRPAHPEFDWFEHNRKKRLMTYETGEKLAEIDDNGRGRWYYSNGSLALDYYDALEINAQQRFVIYSSGLPDERGRSRPRTILATFDYLGNGIVFDHTGKIRLKYNQTEGVVLDRTIGPVSHWKWHTLNDPPVLQQVMIDTQMPHKDPDIIKLGQAEENRTRPDNEEMLAIEFDNFVKEKSKKLTQQFKPFQIRMKALKLNECFSLRILDQATIYLIFRDGSANLKMNLGMVLDHKEIVDTDTAEVGEVSSSVQQLPARTESVAALQRGVARARLAELRRRRLRVAAPRASADRLTRAASKPLPQPLRTEPARPSCLCNRRFSSTLYYDTRLL